jgi:hypothetical protein
MFISDLAYMVMKPLAKGVTIISKNTSEVASDSDVGKYIFGGIVLIGGIIYLSHKDDTTSIYNKD